MTKFKKGDRCEVTQDTLQFKKGAIVTILESNSHVPFCKADDVLMVDTDWKEYHEGGHNCISEDDLKLITMNDTDKVETTVANIKAAHAKGCSTGKAMIEALFPKVFEKEDEETYRAGDRIVFMGAEYILSQVDSNLFCMINVVSGNRHRKALKVENLYRITKQEMFQMTGTNDYKRL